jgi:hypothetical protein
VSPVVTQEQMQITFAKINQIDFGGLTNKRAKGLYVDRKIVSAVDLKFLGKAVEDDR